MSEVAKGGATQMRLKGDVPRVLLLVALIAGIFGGAVAAALYLQSRPKDHEVVLVGPDVSRHGGQSISLTSGGEIYRQTCSGPCDLVSLEIWPRNQEYRVEIRDAKGACILCEPVYADSAGRYRETIAGREKLAVQVKTISSY